MANPYLKSKIMTASPGELLLMLYDGAIGFCRKAGRHLGRGNVDEAREPIGRALAIVQELHGMLNPAHAPELCSQLESLYVFCEQRLLQSLASRSAEAVGDVLKVLEDLRQGWAEAVEKAERADEVQAAMRRTG